MIPAPFIDKLTAFLAWLAERLAEIRERNALRALAELEQAGLQQAKCEPAGDAQDPALAAPLAADAAPAGPDARDGSRGRLPATRSRPSPTILVPDGCADAALAAAGHAGARMPRVSLPDIAALCGLARNRWARQAVASVRVRGADGVGWEANSGLGRCGRRTPRSLRYRINNPRQISPGAYIPQG
ncbi:MAG: hypothetical protein HIU82_21435 [Proteobacteria bacterium]|nr:hypothetical protein [Pseudomonadota bacterium]